jgi:hypothetical protein
MSGRFPLEPEVSSDRLGFSAGGSSAFLISLPLSPLSAPFSGETRTYFRHVFASYRAWVVLGASSSAAPGTMTNLRSGLCSCTGSRMGCWSISPRCLGSSSVVVDTTEPLCSFAKDSSSSSTHGGGGRLARDASSAVLGTLMFGFRGSYGRRCESYLHQQPLSVDVCRICAQRWDLRVGAFGAGSSP